jgi:hypothetical protein
MASLARIAKSAPGLCELMRGCSQKPGHRLPVVRTNVWHRKNRRPDPDSTHSSPHSLRGRRETRGLARQLKGKTFFETLSHQPQRQSYMTQSHRRAH